MGKLSEFQAISTEADQVIRELSVAVQYLQQHAATLVDARSSVANLSDMAKIERGDVRVMRAKLRSVRVMLSRIPRIRALKGGEGFDTRETSL